jgi:two-component system CheB/CheR fusion protein
VLPFSDPQHAKILTGKMLIKKAQIGRRKAVAGLFSKPGYLFAVTILSIFFSESLVMLFLSKVRTVSFFRLTMLDGSILSVVLFPILYFLVFKPMRTHLDERRKMEASLQKARDELESKVKDRTAELLVKNEELKRRARQLGRLSLELTMAEERERRRIAEMLHDNLQQLLVGAKIGLEIFSQRIDPVHKKEIDPVLELILKSIRSARCLTCELSPSALHYGEFSVALKWLARWMQERFGLAVELKLNSKLDPKNESLSVLLFHSVRELLFNVVKHAGTKSARIEMDKAEGKLRILVRDEGTGFDPAGLWDNLQRGTGFGLYSIRERMEYIGGHLGVESAPGSGSTFTLIAASEETEDTKGKGKSDTVINPV